MAVLKLVPREIETSGVQETRAFSMKANGKAFKVLIDGLYADKPRAAVRELWSNAYDSHVAANNPAPFDTHLPTVLEPWFSVRDYGTSMTHEQIMGLYSTVFDSSKEDDDNQVGKLGLGSKSPFAYTDTFTVTAWLGGNRRTYSAYVGADHIPQIALMDTTFDAAPDGIEVSFPVVPDDCYAFKMAARKTIIGFDPRPNVSGESLGASCFAAPIQTGTGWRTYHDLGGAWARQGCVIYPLDVNVLHSNLPDESYDILSSGLVIDFPIGSLEIAASREALGYDSNTLSTVRARVQEVFTEMSAAIEAAVTAADTLWDKYLVLLELERAGYPSSLLKVVRSGLLGRSEMEYVLPSDVRGTYYSRSSLSTQRPSKRSGYVSALHVHPRHNNHYVFVDSTLAVKCQWERLQHRFLTESFDRMFVLQYNSTTRPGLVDEFLAACSGIPLDRVHKIEDLPAPPKDARAYTRTPAPVREVGYGDFDRWFERTVNIEDGGIYVNSCRKDITSDGLAIGGWDLSGVVGALDKAGLGTGQVYVVPASRSKPFNEKNGWVSFKKWGAELCNMHAISVATALEWKHAADAMVNSGYDVPDELVEQLPPDHLLCQYHRDYAEASQARKLTPQENAVKMTGDLIGHRPWEADAVRAKSVPVPAWTAWATVCAKYPLIEHLDLNRAPLKHVVEYVSAIDARALAG